MLSRCYLVVLAGSLGLIPKDGYASGVLAPALGLFGSQGMILILFCLSSVTVCIINVSHSFV
jgi:hypothetical protein